MPYDKKKGGGSCSADDWAVINQETGKTMGCHPSESAADDQLAALYANVPDVRERPMPTDQTRGRPQRHTDAQRSLRHSLDGRLRCHG